MQLMRQEGEVQGFQAEMFRRDGGKILVAINARAVLDENNRLVYYEGFIQDITPRQANSGKS
jgi:PAS domain S-box-containing protein